MISKWKYNYTDQEKGMELTIQNLKQEIDKLVDTNEDINREFSQYKYESKKEIERLNNIINKAIEYLKENAWQEDIIGDMWTTTGEPVKDRYMRLEWDNCNE